MMDMTNEENKKKLYNEKEVSSILKRAVEFQHASKETKERSVRLTQADLEKIAAESGIELKHLSHAIDEFEHSEVEKRSVWIERIFGVPFSLTETTRLDKEIPDRSYDQLIALIQDVTRSFGHSSVIGTTLNWQLQSLQQGYSLQVRMSPQAGQTRVMIDGHYGALAGALFGSLTGGLGLGVGFGVGLGVGLGALHSPLFAILFSLGVFSGAFLLARFIYVQVMKMQKKLLQKLADRIREFISGL